MWSRKPKRPGRHDVLGPHIYGTGLQPLSLDYVKSLSAQEREERRAKVRTALKAAAETVGNLEPDQPLPFEAGSRLGLLVVEKRKLDIADAMAKDPKNDGARYAS